MDPALVETFVAEGYADITEAKNGSILKKVVHAALGRHRRLADELRAQLLRPGASSEHPQQDCNAFGAV